MKKKILGLLIAFAALPQLASGAIVYQSVPDIFDSSAVSASFCSSCAGDDVFSDWQVFDQFTLDSDTAITGFSVSLYAGVFVSDPPGTVPYWPSNITFLIYKVGSDGGPEADWYFRQEIQASSFAATSVPGSDSVVVETDDVTNLNLFAGTYYVSFFNPDRLAVNAFENPLGNLYRRDPSDFDNVFGESLAGSAGFTLTAPVPLPAAAWLLLSGLAGLGVFGRRRAVAA